MDNTTESSTQDVQVKPKNPGRVAWGKELNKRKREGMYQVKSSSVPSSTSSVPSSAPSSVPSSTSSTSSTTPSSSLSSWIPWGITALAIGVAFYIFNRAPTQNPTDSKATPDHAQHSEAQSTKLHRSIGNPFIVQSR